MTTIPAKRLTPGDVIVRHTPAGEHRLTVITVDEADGMIFIDGTGTHPHDRRPIFTRTAKAFASTDEVTIA